MFGREDELVRLLLALGVGSGLLSAVLTWAVARRYGRARALVVPVLALAAVAVMLGRAGAAGGHEAMGAISAALVLAGPAVAGGLLGLVLSGWRKR
jgi:hypothetical protein